MWVSHFWHRSLICLWFHSVQEFEVTKQHGVIKPITEGAKEDHRHPHFGTSSQIGSLETSRLIGSSVGLYLIYLPKIIKYRHELRDKFYACYRAIEYRHSWVRIYFPQCTSLQREATHQLQELDDKSSISILLSITREYPTTIYRVLSFFHSAIYLKYISRDQIYKKLEWSLKFKELSKSREKRCYR